jgi:hypothetical protein
MPWPGEGSDSHGHQIHPFLGSSQVWGFYLMDEPRPSSCPAVNLKAESDWIHANDPGAKTFIIEQEQQILSTWSGLIPSPAFDGHLFLAVNTACRGGDWLSDVSPSCGPQLYA